MPIYEYKCKQCHYKREYLQKTNETPITKCPQCGSTDFHKCVSASTVISKNSQATPGTIPPCQLTGQCNGCGCES